MGDLHIMLTHVLIISPAGLAIVDKGFVSNLKKTSMLGPLLSAIKTFALSAVGVPISYLKLSTMTVSIRTDPRTNVTCVVFFDLDDTPEFCHIISDGILSTFLEEYAEYDFKGSVDLENFKPFASKIPDALRNVVQPLILRLNSYPSIHVVSCLDNNQNVTSTKNVEPIRITANWNALLTASNAALAPFKDTTLALTSVGTSKRMFILKINKGCFIVSCRKGHDPKHSIAVISHTFSYLSKLFDLIDNISKD